MPAINEKIVLGLDDVRAKLKELPSRLGKNAIRRALYAAAQVVRDKAKQKAPVRTGALQKSIIATSRKSRRSQEGEYIATVAIDKRAFKLSDKGKLTPVGRKMQKWRGLLYVRGEIYPRNYAHLVEFGTKPRLLIPRQRRKRDSYKGPKNHPGSIAKPFMRPALDEGFAPAVKRFTEVARRETEKELAKIAKEKKS